MGIADGDTAQDPTVGSTAFAVLAAISFCHLLNDMMQSVLPAIYPILKSDFDLHRPYIDEVTLPCATWRRSASCTSCGCALPRSKKRCGG